MEVRKYQPSDYFELCTWWELQKWPSMGQDHLPENGFIVEGIAAGFLYKTDSKFALMEFIIANPKTEKETRAQALDLVIDSLLNLAKELDFKSVFSSITHPKLLQRYQQHGFVVTDENMTNLVRSL
jgi:hypothetical protein